MYVKHIMSIIISIKVSVSRKGAKDTEGEKLLPKFKSNVFLIGWRIVTITVAQLLSWNTTLRSQQAGTPG